ncbi:hypothetical protein [Streptomyces xiamenensis]|uniref:hypothetical protein n=1 Tax=Streptomyces xiamenensis TaxID=408015 RepID=UPI0035D5E8CE
MYQLASPERVERLTELGVSDALFEAAVRYAIAEAKQNSKYDAPAMPGITFWSRTNRFLAERLTDPENLGKVWKRTSRDSILRVIHPDATHAITAISGWGSVGDPEEQARTKNPKGGAMARLVEENAFHLESSGQHALVSRDEVRFGRELDSIPLWIFLYQYKEGRPIKAELSRPVEMEGKHITVWHERIPIALPDMDPGLNISLSAPELDDAPAVDVPVQRKREE